MGNWPTNWRRFAEPSRFLMVGTACAILGNGLVWLIAEGLHVQYLVAYIVAFVAVNYVGFLLNRTITFKAGTDRGSGRLVKYYAAMLITLGLNLISLHLLVDVAGMNLIVACILLTALFPPLNYMAHKLWTFRREER